MKEHFVEVEGVRLHAVEEGQGVPVVVLHGFTGDAESMAPVSRALRDDHRVVRLELVGHGASEAPESPAPYAMEACARQILGAVEALGLAPTHLLGYSMGGRAALATSLLAPDRFLSLTLIGATAGLADASQRAARVASDVALAERIEREGIERFVDEWMALPLFASQARLGAAALARARAQRLRASPRGLANSLRGMGTGAQPPLHEALGTHALPVLLVVGDEDEKFQGLAAELEARLPDARVAVLVEAGHAAHLEAPEAFRSAVLPFLAAHAPPAGVRSSAPRALDAPRRESA